MTSSSFAAAQQRILARQQQRSTQLENSAGTQPPSQTSHLLQKLPSPFNTIVSHASSTWFTISTRSGTNPAFRVGQIDAELLDEELLQLFHNQVNDALKYFSESIRENYIPEILLCLRTILFKVSIWDHSASYGATLQNLHYVDGRHKGLVPRSPSRWQKALYGLSTVGARYGWEKWEGWLAGQERDYDEFRGRRRGASLQVRVLKRVTDMASTAYTTAAFFSFLVFLYNGRYRTLTDRILRLRLAPKNANVSRQVSFEYLNRQLVWHAFTEFLLFLLPLVGISRWRRWLSRAWRHMKALAKGTTNPQADSSETLPQGELPFLPERTCAICFRDQNPISSSGASTTTEAAAAASAQAQGGIVGSALTDITNPYETIPCGCVYCFVCIATRLEAEEGEGWVCLRCGVLVKECQPWSGDVVEVPPKEAGKVKKSVSFSDEEEKEGDGNDDDGREGSGKGYGDTEQQQNLRGDVDEAWSHEKGDRP